MGIGGIGIGFTFAAMPGFIVQAVHARDTGSAMGFYQVLRSIGLAIGSAISGVILAGLHPARTAAFPSVGGFRTALLIGAALCLLTAVLTFFLPGRCRKTQRHSGTDADERIVEDGGERRTRQAPASCCDDGIGRDMTPTAAQAPSRPRAPATQTPAGRLCLHSGRERSSASGVSTTRPCATSAKRPASIPR